MKSLKFWSSIFGFALAFLALSAYVTPYIVTPWASRMEVKQIRSDQTVVAGLSLCYQLQQLRRQYYGLRGMRTRQAKQGAVDPDLEREIDSLARQINQLQMEVKRLRLPCR